MKPIYIINLGTENQVERETTDAKISQIGTHRYTLLIMSYNQIWIVNHSKVLNVKEFGMFRKMHAIELEIFLKIAYYMCTSILSAARYRPNSGQICLMKIFFFKFFFRAQNI